MLKITLKGQILKKISLILLFALFFTGCVATKTPQSSQAFQVTLFSPMVKINDVGFFHEYKNELNLQIYSSGVNTANIRIKDKICVNGACFSKSEFNEKFFLAPHYESIFEEILKRQKIYDGKGLTSLECGFRQDLSSYFIKYEVCDSYVKFVDSKNKIRVIIKELK